MARIELYKNRINNMSNMIDNVRAEISSYALSLTELYSKCLNINSSVIDNAISFLSSATKVQEQQIEGLDSTQRKIDDFVTKAQITDIKVENCIRKLSKIYDAVYNYVHNISSDIENMSLAEWLYENWGDRFSYGYMVYDSKSLKYMSDEKFEKYVNQLLSLDDDSLTDEDKTRIFAAMNHSKVKFSNDMSKEKKHSMELYNSLYEKLYPDKKVKSHSRRYKYLIYNNVKKSIALLCSDTMKSGYISLNSCEEAENYTQGSNYMSHGNFNLYNFKSHIDNNGYTSVSFILSTKEKTSTEITVYDADGNLYEEPKYLKGQRDPSSIPQVFTEFGKIMGDMSNVKVALVSGDRQQAKKDFLVDAESFNSKEEFNVQIPPGGCIRITDDADLMNTNPVENAEKEIIVTGINLVYDVGTDLFGDKLPAKVSKVTGGIPFGIAKDTVSNKCISVINGVDMNYAETAATSTVDTLYSKGVDVLVESGYMTGNPAGAGLKFVEYAGVKSNTLLESIAIVSQEEKTYGNGAVVIYSDSAYNN